MHFITGVDCSSMLFNNCDARIGSMYLTGVISSNQKQTFYMLEYDEETFCFTDLKDLHNFYVAQGESHPLEFVGYQEHADFINFNFYLYTL